MGDSLPFFGRTAMIELQFVKSVVNCGLCCLEPIWEFLIVSFEDGSFVRFFPNIAGLHRRASLASSRIECVWRVAVPAPCATLVSFRKEPSPKRARRKDVKSNKGIVLAFQRVQSSLFSFGIEPQKTGTLEHPHRQTIIRFPWNETCCPGLGLSAFHVGSGIWGQGRKQKEL